MIEASIVIKDLKQGNDPNIVVIIMNIVGFSVDQDDVIGNEQIIPAGR